MNKYEIAWFAGLYEGEGCLSRDNRSGHYRLSISMTDKDVVEKATKMVNAKLQKPYQPPNPKHKLQYRFIVYNQIELANLYNKIYPYLGERRKEKIDEFRNWLANSKYGYCRKGIHKLNLTRTSSGKSTRCHLCKMDYQRKYRLQKKMEKNQSNH